MVRALVSHQYGQDSIPGPGVICGLFVQFVVGFLLAPRAFSPVLLFSLSSKTNISKFQFDLERTYTCKQVPESSLVLHG